VNNKKIFQSGLKITVALQKESYQLLYGNIRNEEEKSKRTKSLITISNEG